MSDFGTGRVHENFRTGWTLEWITHNHLTNLKDHCLGDYILNPDIWNLFFMLNGLTQHESGILQISACTCLWALSYPLKPAPGSGGRLLHRLRRPHLDRYQQFCAAANVFCGVFFFSCARKMTPPREIIESDPPAVQEIRKRQKYQNIYIYVSAELLWSSGPLPVPSAHMALLLILGNLALVAVPTSWEPERTFWHKLNWNWSDGGSSWSGHGIKIINHILPRIVFPLDI